MLGTGRARLGLWADRVLRARRALGTSCLPHSLADVSLDVAVPHATGRPPALEVEDCTCPAGYRGASCQVPPSLPPGPIPALGHSEQWLTLPVPAPPAGLRHWLHPQHLRALPGHL